MELTIKQLKQIIKEELDAVFSEEEVSDPAPHDDPDERAAEEKRKADHNAKMRAYDKEVKDWFVSQNMWQGYVGKDERYAYAMRTGRMPPEY